MSLTDILQHKLINLENFKFSVANLLLIITIWLVTRVLAWAVVRLMNRRLHRKGKDTGGRRFAIISITKYIIYVAAILLILANSGLDITVIVAGSTALLVGLGFGLQNLFKDLVSGVILLFEGSLEVNDVVEIGGIIGKVKYIGLRTSKIRSQDGILLVVPNSKFVEDTVTNMSNRAEYSRFHVRVPVAYGSDPAHVRKTILAVAAQHKNISSKLAPDVFFKDYGNSELIFELLVWTNQNFYKDKIESDLRYEIFAALKAEGISIPFPQRDLHLRSSDVDLSPRNLGKPDSAE